MKYAWSRESLGLSVSCRVPGMSHSDRHFRWIELNYQCLIRLKTWILESDLPLLLAGSVALDKLLHFLSLCFLPGKMGMAVPLLQILWESDEMRNAECCSAWKLLDECQLFHDYYHSFNKHWLLDLLLFLRYTDFIIAVDSFELQLWTSLQLFITLALKLQCKFQKWWRTVEPWPFGIVTLNSWVLGEAF